MALSTLIFGFRDQDKENAQAISNALQSPNVILSQGADRYSVYSVWLPPGEHRGVSVEEGLASIQTVHDILLSEPTFDIYTGLPNAYSVPWPEGGRLVQQVNPDGGQNYYIDV